MSMRCSTCGCEHGGAELLGKLIEGGGTEGDRGGASRQHYLDLCNADKGEDTPHIAGFVVGRRRRQAWVVGAARSDENSTVLAKDESLALRWSPSA